MALFPFTMSTIFADINTKHLGLSNWCSTGRPKKKLLGADHYQHSSGGWLDIANAKKYSKSSLAGKNENRISCHDFSNILHPLCTNMIFKLN